MRKIYTYRRLTDVREQPISNEIPLIPISSRHTHSLLFLITYSLAYIILSPDTILTLISPVSSLEDEVIPNL